MGIIGPWDEGGWGLMVSGPGMGIIGFCDEGGWGLTAPGGDEWRSKGWLWDLGDGAGIISWLLWEMG